MTETAEEDRIDERPAPAVDSRRERILDVAERLFAERGARNVTVRDVAAEADVTHPLIYYYWGSKDELLAATLERSQRRVRSVSVDGDRLAVVDALARESLEHNRQYLLTLTRALLDGMQPSEWPGGFPAIDALLRLVLDGAPHEEEAEARARVACGVAMLNGWALIEDALLEVVGLTDGDRQQAREVLFSSLGLVLTSQLEET